MVDPKPLFKTFGSGADVVGQIATDKAVNARRLTDASSSLFDITQGQLIEDHLLSSSGTGFVAGEILHDLGRVPTGVIVLKQDLPQGGGSAVYCEATALDKVTMSADTGITVTVWIV